jgi:hypothetical protein
MPGARPELSAKVAESGNEEDKEESCIRLFRVSRTGK